jgi:undecaprenyl-diphosphatase
MIGSSRRAWIAPGVLLGVFFVLLWQVLSHGFVTRVDVHVRDAVQHAAYSADLVPLLKIGRACADLGDRALTLFCIVVVTAYVAWRCRSWRPVATSAAALVVLASVIPLKIWIARPGPGESVLGDADLGFFPSGHTADSLCCYGMSAFLLGLFVWRGRTARLALGGAVTLLLLLTVFGLLWSNFHWLSDVIGSLCWCGAWLLVIARWSAVSTPADGESRDDASADHATARL